MHYFTPELVWDMPDIEVDAVRESYWKHIAELVLSPDARKLASLNLHDALFLAVEQRDSLHLLFRSGDLEKGYSDVEIEYVAPRVHAEDIRVLKTVVWPSKVELLYDEVDIDEELIHRMLLSSGVEVAIHCSDVRVSQKPVESREAE